ncbi:hypothetical protein M1L60_25890 [Actinoplanes sp. TRM 88003]|uniref:DUF998 domain-containing protein n=1 Tax=Paractinoplanes aksuensis TaxID=2939490 RepID=A0ABT1DT69_9ACTN|nr:hypothetical protein [Actinoplanes aksuensis]MCO8274036.1 hypothetical protein [Actinoplanes aksuensis]
MSALFAFAGLMFLLYPVLRPWTDETTVDGAIEAMSSPAWVASHLFAMLGFLAVSLGLLALHSRVSSRSSLTALLTAWIGTALVLPYYGAEDFGLHALARNPGTDLLTTVDEVRYQPVAVTMFGVGLILLAVAGVATGMAVRGPAGVFFAAGYVLFLPQFFLPPAGRIAHGVILAAGCVWLAARSRSSALSAPHRTPRAVGPAQRG